MTSNKNIYASRKKGLSEFRGILQSYIEIEAHYAKQFDNDDFAFTYGERACVATFAAAAIQNGWAALCEHGHQKINKKDGRKNSWGRGDIYLTKGDAEYYGEAKYKIIEETATDKGWRGQINRTLRAAEKDVENSVKNRREEDEIGLAISFFCFLSKKRDHLASKKWIEGAVSFITEPNDQIDAYAYYTVPKKVIEAISNDWAGSFPIGFIIVLKKMGGER